MTGPLACPTCAASFGEDERFCPDCGVPLVRAGAAPRRSTRAEERRQQARKIKPQYADGRLVRIARAHHQAEAELIQGLLLEEGIPSLVQRSMGFDVPDFMAAGPRDVLVPSSGAAAAQDLLRDRREPGGGAATR